MSFDLNLVIRIAIEVTTAALLWWACWLPLAMFMWGWLAFVLATVLSLAAYRSETVRKVNDRAYDLATTGAAKALDWFAAKRSALSK